MITINDVEYNEETFTEEQTYCLNQVKDLQMKEDQLKFNLHQMTVAKQAFIDALSKSLKEPSEAETNEPD